MIVALVSLTLVLGLAGLPSPTIAQELISELRLGILDHDVPHLWSGFRVERESPDINVEAILSPSFALFGGVVQPAIGGSISTMGLTSNVYLDARWQYEFTGGLFLGLGIGGTIHNGQIKLVDLDRKALGSRLLFHFPLELGWRFDAHSSVSAYFEHMSNGYTASPNEALDRLGIRYGYKF